MSRPRLPKAPSAGFNGKRVLITGGLGFIGSNLARAVVAAGSGVMLVDSLMPSHGGTPANIDGIQSEVVVDVFDLRDARGLTEPLRGRLRRYASDLRPYRELARPGRLERSERLARQVLSLPLYPELRNDEVDAVVAALGEAVRCD